MKNFYILFSLVLFLVFASLNLFAQLAIPAWPESNGYFQYSTHYEVLVRQNPEDAFQKVPVLMSTSQDELIPTFPDGIYQNRTFSYAPFSYNASQGSITIRVRNLDLPGAIKNTEDVELLNNLGELINSKQVIDEQTIEFKLEGNRYTSVYFKLPENLQKSGIHETIKHMLMLFPDPINEDLEEPQGNGKLVYNDQTTEAEVRSADLIVFRPGYHNIREKWGIKGMGITENTTVWLAPGAVVDGTILAVDGQGNNTRINNSTIYGGGILFNGNHRNPINDPTNGPYWHFDASNEQKQTWNDAIDFRGNNNTVRGIIIADIYHHGIVSGNSTKISRVKIWGWHYNCDGMRPGAGTIVEDCFLRPTDDAFYAFRITVRNTLIWQSFNGAVITCGWPGAYSTGGIVMTDCTLIYPEWRGKGNNNGVIASQIGSNQECTSATVNNLKIFGDPIALLNLKPSSRESHPSGTNATNGGVRNIILNNIEINGSLKEPNLLESNGAYNVTNVRLSNVIIKDFADRFLTNEDRANPDLFIGTDLTDDTVLFISASTTSSRSYTNLPSLSIYPNPGKDFLFLEGMKLPTSLKIYNLRGALIRYQWIDHSKLNISNLEGGHYLLIIDGYQPLKFIKS